MWDIFCSGRYESMVRYPYLLSKYVKYNQATKIRRENMKTLKKNLFFLFVALIIKLSFANALCAEDTYSFAVLPRFFPIVIFERFGPLADHIQEETGLEVNLYIPDNFSDHINKVRKGYVLLSYQNPVVYIRVSKEVRPLAIASKGKDKTRFRGIIIVRTDSGINSIKDLKGKSVSVVSMQSAGAFISQKDFLKKKAIDVNVDMKPSEASENKQENVILSVFEKKVDVGFIRESALHRVDKAINPKKIKVLTKTSWLPNWVFAIHKSVKPHIAQKIQNVLIDLPSDSPVLKAAKLDGFVKPDQQALKNLQKMIMGK